MLPATANDNRWIVTAIDYTIRWPVAEAIEKATAETLADFVIQWIYRDYGASKEIITDWEANLWAPAMNLVFKHLKTKHWDTISYHPCMNGAVKQFNEVLSQMLTKYLIGHSIKKWNLYLKQALFTIHVHTYATMKMSSFYLLYDVNLRLSGDASMPTLNRYDERINPALFLSRECAKALQETIAKVMKNKKKWDTQVNSKKTFAVENWVLIWIKKSKKFEVHWYELYQIVWAETLNTYMLKEPEGSKNKYLISENWMKKAWVDRMIIREWRMLKKAGRSKKTEETKLYNARASDHAVVIRSLKDFESLSEEKE